MGQVQTTITIGGTTCSACQKIISKRIGTIFGVQDVAVSVPSGETVIKADRPIEKKEVAAVLQGTHYSV